MDDIELMTSVALPEVEGEEVSGADGGEVMENFPYLNEVSTQQSSFN